MNLFTLQNYENNRSLHPFLRVLDKQSWTFMNEFVDLSHVFEDSMPGFKLKNEDGSFTQYTAKIYPFLTHEQSKPKFSGLAEFEITQIEFQTSIGTYLDSPYHRHKKLRDISSITIDQAIREGLLIDVRECNPNEEINFETIPFVDLENKAILFNFGWDKYWGKEEYYKYPFISEKIIQFLIEKKVGMVGVDTINIDNIKNLKRPAHTKL
ncbi:MAG: Kynurenine formamidase, partial [Candidatus Heimdallarchaeota archaeon LC_3]